MDDDWPGLPPADPPAPLDQDERVEVIRDLEDLEVFRVLLEPRGVRGLVVECEDCDEPHFFSWDLLVGNLRQLLADGTTRVHEPAFDPDPVEYVSWDYAQGYVDAVMDADADADPDDDQIARPRRATRRRG